MTQGDPVSLMIRFAVPMVIGSIFQSLYTMVDQAVLGKFAGSTSLAAIGATTSTVSFLLLTATSVTTAVSIVMSQFVGETNQKGIRQSLVSAIYLLLGFSVVTALIGVVGARPLMKLLNTPENIIDGAVLYIRIISIFCFAQFFYNGSATVLRALGDSRTPLYFLIVCSFLNVVLDLWAVIVMHMGIAGVGLATVLSQFVSAVLCTVVMFRKYPELHLEKEDLQVNRENMLRIFKMGIQMALQSAFLSIGMMAITRIINGYGSDIVAAFTVGSSVQSLCVMFFSQFSFGFSVYAGQNYGAKKADRIHLGVKKMAVMNGSMALVMAILAEIFAGPLVSLYVNAEEAGVTAASISFVRIQSLFMPFLAWIWLLNSTLRGMGRIKETMVSSFVELGSKIGFSAGLPILMGYTGIWFAAPLGWILGALPSLYFYLKGDWEKKLR